MGQAPVTVFVFNAEGIAPWARHSTGQIIDDLVNVQSIGAAIENMILAAQDLGLGSLWICDVLYAYEEFRELLGEKGALVAAVSFGFPGESPEARPRKSMAELARIL